jgi:hypothetical protein
MYTRDSSLVLSIERVLLFAALVDVVVGVSLQLHVQLLLLY